MSRNSCGSQNSSVYQAKIESLQDQVQILLNQSAEKEDKLQRMESELEDTKRQMKELINLYKQEQVKKTIEEQIPTSRRGHGKTHFEEERSQVHIHKPEPRRPQPKVQPTSHPSAPPKPPPKPATFHKPPTPSCPLQNSMPLDPNIIIQPSHPQNFSKGFPVTLAPQTTFESRLPTPVPTESHPPPAPVEEKTGKVQNSTLPPPQNSPPTEDKIFFQTLTQALSSISQKVNDQTFRASAPRRSNSLQVRLPDLPHFDASLPEIIVYFFEQFELIKEIQQWEDKECIDHLRLKHTGTAKTILEEEIRRVPSLTYENLKKRLMDRYLSPAVMQSVMDQLLQAKQTADESLNQYYNRFKYLDKVVASRTEDWYIGRFEVNCFVKGFLNKTLSDNVCRRYPKTLDEAYQFALEENRLFYMQSGLPQISTQPPPPPKPDNPPAQQGHNQGSQNQNQQNSSQQNNYTNKNWSKNNNRGWQNNNQKQNNNQRQNQGQNQNRQNRPQCATCGFANHQSDACWYNPSGQNFKGITFNPEKHSYAAFLKRRADQNSGQNTGQGNTNNNKNQSQNQGGRGQGGRTYKNNNANPITNPANRQTTIINSGSNPTTAAPPTSNSPPPVTVDQQFMADFASHFWQELYKSNPANLVPLDQQGNGMATASYPDGSPAGGIGLIHM